MLFRKPFLGFLCRHFKKRLPGEESVEKTMTAVSWFDELRGKCRADRCCSLLPIEPITCTLNL